VAAAVLGDADDQGTIPLNGVQAAQLEQGQSVPVQTEAEPLGKRHFEGSSVLLQVLREQLVHLEHRRLALAEHLTQLAVRHDHPAVIRAL